MLIRPIHSRVRRPYRSLTLECLEDRCQPSTGELRRLAVPVAAPLAAPQSAVVTPTPLSSPTTPTEAPGGPANDSIAPAPQETQDTTVAPSREQSTPTPTSTTSTNTTS